MPIDYRDYPANWKTHIVPAVRARGGNRCEWCGAPNGEHVIRDLGGKPYTMSQYLASGLAEDFFKPGAPVKIILTVAHLDHDKAHNDGMDTGGPALPLGGANLVHLCQRCHLNHDRPRHLEKQRRNREARRGQLALPGAEARP